MDSKLRIITYNCQSFTSNVEVITDLLKMCDILLLQETLVNDVNSYLLEGLDDNFCFSYTPSSRQNNVLYGRSSGGLAIYWRRLKEVQFKPIYLSNRIMGLKLVFENVSFLICNIYCPCDYRDLDSLIEYRSTLSEIENLVQEVEFGELIIAGDFNCDPHKGRFYKEFDDLARNYNFSISDIENLPYDSFTYVSQSPSCGTSWIDHILVSSPQLVDDCSILYGTKFDDHIPLYFTLNTPGEVTAHQAQSCDGVMSQSNFFVFWDKATREQIDEYASTLEYFCTDFLNDSLLCNIENCNDQNHKQLLNQTFDFLKNSIFESSVAFPSSGNCPRIRKRPGWSEYCRDLYNNASDKFLLWKSLGRVRGGVIFEDMKQSRARFRAALKYIKDNEIRIRKQNLVRAANSNRKIFWKRVRKFGKGSDKNQSYCIDGSTDLRDITSGFSDKFRRILDDPSCQSSEGSTFQSSEGSTFQSSEGSTWPSNYIQDLDNYRHLFSLENIDRAIGRLNTGIGWDGVHSSHLKYSGKSFRKLLGRLFLKLISHNHLPPEMILGEVRPIIKNGAICKTISDNYRPIMNSSGFLKVFEYALLPCLTEHLKLSPHQFGFRSETGTIQAISVLKETINSYTEKRSSVHCAFIDMTKAFDKLNVNFLILKLKSKNLPKSVIKIIERMYLDTNVRIKFNGVTSDEWRVGNGVRQGGILSPYLFNFYINDIIEEISNLDVGCSLGMEKMNLICYADDIVLISPSANGLQYLIDRISSLLIQHGMVINVGKSSYIVFGSKSSINKFHSIVLLGEEMKRSPSCVYLGTVLSGDMSLKLDMDRAMNAYLKQFNSIYYRFNSLDSNLKFFLYKAFTSFYAIELWYDNLINRNKFRKVEICYHKCVKKVAGLNVWDSNHLACSIVGVPVFRHLLAWSCLSLYNRMFKTRSPCVSRFRYFYRYRSLMSSRVRELFRSIYNINEIFDNDLAAIKSRINYIERNEPRSSYGISVN